MFPSKHSAMSLLTQAEKRPFNIIEKKNRDFIYRISEMLQHTDLAKSQRPAVVIVTMG